MFTLYYTASIDCDNQVEKIWVCFISCSFSTPPLTTWQSVVRFYSTLRLFWQIWPLWCYLQTSCLIQRSTVCQDVLCYPQEEVWDPQDLAFMKIAGFWVGKKWFRSVSSQQWLLHKRPFSLHALPLNIISNTKFWECKTLFKELIHVFKFLTHAQFLICVRMERIIIKKLKM